MFTGKLVRAYVVFTASLVQLEREAVSEHGLGMRSPMRSTLVSKVLSGSLGQWVAGAQPTQVGLRETLVPRQGAVEVTASQVLLPDPRPSWPPTQPIGTQKQAAEASEWSGLIERRYWLTGRSPSELLGDGASAAPPASHLLSFAQGFPLE